MIDAVSGAVIDPQLQNAFADVLDVARVTVFQTAKPANDARHGIGIPEAVQPDGKLLGLTHLDHHRCNVACRLQSSSTLAALAGLALRPVIPAKAGIQCCRATAVRATAR